MTMHERIQRRQRYEREHCPERYYGRPWAACRLLLVAFVVVFIVFPIVRIIKTLALLP